MGGESVAGNKQKETGTIDWLTPNIGATNESGVTALQGGYRSYDGTFNNIRWKGYWWSSTEDSAALAFCRDINYNFGKVDKTRSNKNGGFSIRCLKNKTLFQERKLIWQCYEYSFWII